MLQGKLILTSVLLFIGVSCWAQEFYLGVKGGYNNSNLESEALSNPKELNDLHAWNLALVYSYQMQSLPIGLSIEAGYTLKGTRTNVDSLNYRFDYLSIPILADIYFLKKFKISAGPEFSYLSRARNMKNDSTIVSILNTYNKRWELSGSVALSYSISFFADLGVKYNRSFTSVSKMDAVLDRKNLYNQYFQIFLLLKIAN